MNKAMYWFGRGLQLFALLTMPSAIWIAEFQKNEQAAISMFLGSLVLFYVGWLFTKGYRGS